MGRSAKRSISLLIPSNFSAVVKTRERNVYGLDGGRSSSSDVPVDEA